MNRYIPIVLASMLALGGCAGTAARAIKYSAEVETAAANLVKERWELRRQIRAACEKLLWAEYDSLVADGNFDAAKTLLALNYPSLLSLEVITRYREGTLGDIGGPWGCEVQVIPDMDRGITAGFSE